MRRALSRPSWLVTGGAIGVVVGLLSARLQFGEAVVAAHIVVLAGFLLLRKSYARMTICVLIGVLVGVFRAQTYVQDLSLIHI